MDSAVEARLRLLPGLFMFLNAQYLIMLTSLTLNSGAPISTGLGLQVPATG